MLKKEKKIAIFERLLWKVIWNFTIRPFPRRLALKWEILVLTLFGAKIHSTAQIYSSTRIWLPRNLQMDEYSTLADHVDVFNVSKVHLKAYSSISQYSSIFTGSRALKNESFEIISDPIIIEENAWVASHSLILSGAKICRESVVGAGSVVRTVIPPYSIVIGNPPMVVGFRYALEEMKNKEQNIYKNCNSISTEVLERNYEKYFLMRLKEINKFTKV